MTFALEDTDGDPTIAYFGSRESGNGPVLNIDLTPPPTPTPAPTPTPVPTPSPCPHAPHAAADTHANPRAHTSSDTHPNPDKHSGWRLQRRPGGEHRLRCRIRRHRLRRSDFSVVGHQGDVAGGTGQAVLQRLNADGSTGYVFRHRRAGHQQRRQRGLCRRGRSVGPGRHRRREVTATSSSIATCPAAGPIPISATAGRCGPTSCARRRRVCRGDRPGRVDRRPPASTSDGSFALRALTCPMARLDRSFGNDGVTLIPEGTQSGCHRRRCPVLPDGSIAAVGRGREQRCRASPVMPVATSIRRSGPAA